MFGWRLGILSGVAMAALLAVMPAHAQSLSDTVRTAVSTSPRVESMIHNRESVDAEMRRAKGLYLPQLDVRSAIGPEYTENVLTQGTNGQHMRSELGAVLAEKLYDGGATAGQVDHERGRSKSAAYRIRENAEFTGLDAVEAHLDVVRFRHVFQFAQDNVKAHQALLIRVQQRSTGGAGRAADVAQAQSRLDLATATRDETRGMLEDAEARYLNVVGVAPAALEDTPVPTERHQQRYQHRARAAPGTEPDGQGTRSRYRGGARLGRAGGCSFRSDRLGRGQRRQIAMSWLPRPR